MNTANVAAPILAFRNGCYIDACLKGGAASMVDNLFKNCNVALVYRNQNRIAGPLAGTFIGATFNCNTFDTNFEDVLVMSDVGTPPNTHGINLVQGSQDASPANDMLLSPNDSNSNGIFETGEGTDLDVIPILYYWYKFLAVIHKPLNTLP